VLLLNKVALGLLRYESQNANLNDEKLRLKEEKEKDEKQRYAARCHQQPVPR